MSDVTDSLNIIANMFNTVADYELKDSQFKQSLEHQEFLEDKKEDAQLEKLNIEMNLSNLREKNKEVKVLIRDRLDKANAAKLNDIVSELESINSNLEDNESALDDLQDNLDALDEQKNNAEEHNIYT